MWTPITRYYYYNWKCSSPVKCTKIPHYSTLLYSLQNIVENNNITSCINFPTYSKCKSYLLQSTVNLAVRRTRYIEVHGISRCTVYRGAWCIEVHGVSRCMVYGGARYIEVHGISRFFCIEWIMIHPDSPDTSQNTGFKYQSYITW